MNEELQGQKEVKAQAVVATEYQAPALEVLGTWNELTRTMPGTGFGGGEGG